MTVKLIAHTLIEKDGKYLLIKRSKIKRGLPNVYPSYWDIPGGSVEENELPREAALREAIEEVNQKLGLIRLSTKIVNLMPAKILSLHAQFIVGEILEERDFILDPEEHTDFKWISSLKDIESNLVVPYLLEILADKSK